jgi:cold shock CspA family protein
MDAEGKVIDVVAGKVIRFDELKGYGFIAPDNGSEDVFVHANDLLDGKSLFKPGQPVEFTIEDGGRGLKASDVRIIGGPVATGTHRPADGTEAEDGLCDLLLAAEFRLELTEALLAVVPSLSGEQILAVRRRVTELATAHNWVEP